MTNITPTPNDDTPKLTREDLDDYLKNIVDHSTEVLPEGLGFFILVAPMNPLTNKTPMKFMANLPKEICIAWMAMMLTEEGFKVKKK